MFVDASAICSILLREEDGDRLYVRLRSSPDTITSAMAFWESAVAISRRLNMTPTQASALVRSLLEQTKTQIVAVPPEAADLAVEAFERFGKGRHPAALNFGDCFSYACARQLDLPLLFKGDDFPQTDIASALAAD